MQETVLGLSFPKDPAVLKILRRTQFTLAVAIRTVEISCEFSPGKIGVSETLPYCFTAVGFFATT